ncbi:MAG: carbamoyltransferase HypF [Armatimonadetes bacterium]|nr:carbamoyltransferase HypF [Armatimonadota bacterium]
MARRITVEGVVQGVGFRPFVYRLAHRHGLAGWVANSSSGVIIEVEGPRSELDAFESALTREAPVLARIDEVHSAQADALRPDSAALPQSQQPSFEIRRSERTAEDSTLICPDVAVCADCLSEFLDPADRRHLYPFINCTNCGPRFSIIEDTPYDRPATSMAGFGMCERCRAEYDDPLDRRFHAQPNACPVCGPRLRLEIPGGPDRGLAETVLGRSYVRIPEDIRRAFDADSAAAARWLLKRGAILGIRGLGGFHIAADATLDTTVRALREKKNRPAKPLAVMCRSLSVARDLAVIGTEEEAVLTSPWSPVVLLRKHGTPMRVISDLIAPANSYLGIMLPYAPIHHLLFDNDLEVLVMTSANAPGEPIAATVDEALERLPGITRTFLDHDREVVNRNDDSVVFVEGGRTMMSRRSRGYAPYPIDLGIETADILACGTELKSTFALLHGGRAYVGPHIGDLENQATLDLYEEMVAKFMRWFRFTPSAVGHDLHPDYLATRFATSFARERGLPLYGVQHHHAHIVSVAAENRITEPVIGVALDGTGYGTDGRIWGCEFLVSEFGGFERAGHLKYVPLPGGDAAIRHPYRVALSHLRSAGFTDLACLAAGLFPEVQEEERDLVVQQIERGINSVDTSSAGRLFDAVSALLGVCHEISYEAQAAIELESITTAAVGAPPQGPLAYDIAEVDGELVIDPSGIIRGVLSAREQGQPVETIAAAFHETVVSFCLDVCRELRDRTGLKHAALSGGVFQNRYLLGRLTDTLTKDGFTVLVNREVPANDGGVSLGQAVVASERHMAA